MAECGAAERAVSGSGATERAVARCSSAAPWLSAPLSSVSTEHAPASTCAVAERTTAANAAVKHSAAERIAAMRGAAERGAAESTVPSTLFQSTPPPEPRASPPRGRSRNTPSNHNTGHGIRSTCAAHRAWPGHNRRRDRAAPTPAARIPRRWNHQNCKVIYHPLQNSSPQAEKFFEGHSCMITLSPGARHLPPHCVWSHF